MKILFFLITAACLSSSVHAAKGKKESLCGFNLQKLEKSVELQKESSATRVKATKAFKDVLNLLKESGKLEEAALETSIKLADAETVALKKGDELTDFMNDMISDAKKNCR